MLALLPPTQFRFADAEDIAAYGDGWHIWDEQALLALRGRELIALEEAINLPIRVLIEELRTDSTLAYMAAMWIALHREGHQVAWKDFNPAVQLAEWAPVPPDPTEGSGEDPTPDSSSSTEPTPESATSSPA